MAWNCLSTRNLHLHKTSFTGQVLNQLNRLYTFLCYFFTLDTLQFSHLCMLTNDGRCTCEMKSRTAMEKAAFNKKKTLFTSKLDLNLKKKLGKCYIWSMALYGAETWTLRAADQKYLESFEMWCWRMMEKISWTNHVRKEELLLIVNEQMNILHEIENRRLIGLVTCYVETAF